MIFISTVLEKYEQINSLRYHQSVTFIDKKYHQPHNSHFRRSLRIASIFSGSYRLQVLLAAFIFIIMDVPLYHFCSFSIVQRGGRGGGQTHVKIIHIS